MDLAKFAQMPQEQNSFLKFTANDNVKIVRFLYGTTPGVDEDLGISCRQKLFDSSTKKVIWDTPEGKWTMSLKVAVYTSKTEYQLMTWDRSAVFGRDYLLPLFEAAGGRIIDTVYKITCSKAGTLDATFSFFPIKDSETYAVPSLVESVEEVEEAVAQPAPVQTKPVQPAPQQVQPKVAVAPTAPAFATASAPKKKNFWEE